MRWVHGQWLGPHQNNGDPVHSSGGTFKSNISLNAVTIGPRTFDLKGADFHSPIAVKLFAQSDQDAQRFEPVPDAAVDKPNSAFRFALSEDVPHLPGMTPLDVARTADLGRMLSPTGNRATRTQMFLPIPEKKNRGTTSARSSDLIIVGSVPNGTVKLTPILAGTPDIPESLVFGETLEIEPSTMAAGKTGVTMLPRGGFSPQRMCVLGLDLSGDLRVEPGRAVVGYQLECPAGINSPIKMIPVGKQEAMVYASNGPTQTGESLSTDTLMRSPSFEVYAQAEAPTAATTDASGLSGSAEGDAPGTPSDEFAPDDRVYTQYIGPLFRQGQVGTPQAFPLPDYLGTSTYSAQSAFLDDMGTPGTNFTPVPAPGAIALLGLAAAAATRRRRV